MTTHAVLVGAIDRLTGRAAPRPGGRTPLDWLLAAVAEARPDRVSVLLAAAAPGTETGSASTTSDAAAAEQAIASFFPQAAVAWAVGSVPAAEKLRALVNTSDDATVFIPLAGTLLQADTVRRLVGALGSAPACSWPQEPPDDAMPFAVDAAAVALIPADAMVGSGAVPCVVHAYPWFADPRIKQVEIDVGEGETLQFTGSDRYGVFAAALRARLVRHWAQRGVLFEDPDSAVIDFDVTIEPGAHIYSQTMLLAGTAIGAGCEIGPQAVVRGSRVGAGTRLRFAVCEGVQIGAHCNIGPFTWLRSGTQLHDEVRAGAFVEIAACTVGRASAVPHISVLSGTVVGTGTNIGGLTATANYDGQDKFITTIGDNVCIGAGNVLIAPVQVADGAYTAAGSTITEDVPSEALGIARAAQRNVAGWVRRRRTAAR